MMTFKGQTQICLIWALFDPIFIVSCILELSFLRLSCGTAVPQFTATAEAFPSAAKTFRHRIQHTYMATFTAHFTVFTLHWQKPPMAQQQHCKIKLIQTTPWTANTGGCA